MKIGQKELMVADQGDFSVLVHPLTKEDVRLLLTFLNSTSYN